MTPEAARFLEKAQTLLNHADIMLSVNLNNDAGRTAYLAGFHAAQAFIFERLGKSLKTHQVEIGKQFVAHIAALLSPPASSNHMI